MMLNTKKEADTKDFLKQLKELYSFDLTNYRYAYIERRIERRMEKNNIDTITEFTDLIINNSKIAKQFIRDISIHVTSMFRMPEFFKTIKTEVIPHLKTYPSISIWHAGCSSGEEVLSLAIILKETGIYDRCKIYATDISEKALSIAKKAIYPIKHIKQWTLNYNEAGGNNSFADYFTVKYNQVKFDRNLLENVEYMYQDLTNEEFDREFHLIICRNVLIYFDKTLQERTIKLFYNNLIEKGYLGLGSKENIYNTDFKVINKKVKLYQK